jgi:hypothetical protein
MDESHVKITLQEFLSNHNKNIAANNYEFFHTTKTSSKNIIFLKKENYNTK